MSPALCSFAATYWKPFAIDSAVESLNEARSGSPAFWIASHTASGILSDCSYPSSWPSTCPP